MGEIERILKKLIKVTDWPNEVKTGLTPKVSVPSRLYGLPKLQKQGCLLRPAVNMASTPMYIAAK